MGGSATSCSHPCSTKLEALIRPSQCSQDPSPGYEVGENLDLSRVSGRRRANHSTRQSKTRLPRALAELSFALSLSHFVCTSKEDANPRTKCRRIVLVASVSRSAQLALAKLCKLMQAREAFRICRPPIPQGAT